MSKIPAIRVFEHESLRIDGIENPLPKDCLEALQKYHGEKGCPYFSLTHHGVKFKSYVGVIQVGKYTIEVLPKIDRHPIVDKNNWQSFLIRMLRYAGLMDMRVTSDASLRIKHNSILDLYIGLFVKEMQYLAQLGLIKKYRRTESNATALKGALVFPKQIQQNLIHGERFYVRHTTYDRNHLLHRILFQALQLLLNMKDASRVSSEVNNLIFDFPACSPLAIKPELFNSIVYDRKTAVYRKAIEISKLLLLNYHPDIQAGHNPVLALMFDMDKLWEEYIFKCLKKQLQGQYVVRKQLRQNFWKPASGQMKVIKPDMVVYDSEGLKVLTVLDTKWKTPKGEQPDDADLKQMMTYNYYFGCKESALLYPDTGTTASISGAYQLDEKCCSMIWLPLSHGDSDDIINLSVIKKFIEKLG